jgi:hypothetical protein
MPWGEENLASIRPSQPFPEDTFRGYFLELNLNT